MTPEGFIVDDDTGEYINRKGVFIAEEENERRREYFAKKQKEDLVNFEKLKNENTILKEKLGIESIEDLDNEKISTHFIWTYFQEQQKLFPDLKPQDISRLIYLSTYLDYKTNILINKNVPIKKSQLNKLMNLSRCTFNSWLEKMTNHNYIEFHGDNVTLNKGLFNKGELSKGKDIRAVRLFIDIIRDLYLNLQPSDHYKMGLVLQLIPYVNPHFNCLATNPKEKNRENLIPLKLGQLAKDLGYSDRHCRRLGDELLSIRFGKDSKRIVIAVALDSLSPKEHILIFNSKLFFGGNKKEYELINSIFDNYQSEELMELDL